MVLRGERLLHRLVERPAAARRVRLVELLLRECGLRLEPGFFPED